MWLSTFARRIAEPAWLDAIDEAPLGLDRRALDAVEVLRALVEAGREVDGRGAAVFNRLVRLCWQGGYGPEASGAAGLQRERAER